MAGFRTGTENIQHEPGERKVLLKITHSMSKEHKETAVH